jgi:hypothetical protein
MALFRFLLPVVLLLANVAPAAAALEPVGSYNPGTEGLNAGATGLEGFAYLGSWGSAGNCPGLGVRVVDIQDPSSPRGIGTIAAYPRTTAEHVIAQRIATPAFSGNLLLTGIQQCNAGPAEGALAIWDVSNPYEPREVGYLGMGRGSRGVHEFNIKQIGGRWYAFLAVSNSETLSGKGDLRIVDFTDPANPMEIADWNGPRDGGLRVGSGGQCAPACRGVFSQAFLHSVNVSPDGTRAYLSYWDQGVVILDIRDLSSLKWLGQFMAPLTAEGNTHSVSLTPDNRVALVADENFAPPWTRLRVLDVSDPSNPWQVGAYETPNNAAEHTGPGETWYSIHNPLVDDRNPNQAYLAWYADGVRLVDISNPAAVTELASWVPARAPQVWSVSFMDDYVVVGDVNTGLHILRR